ncbi:hypothetical protein BDQ17DRAFT_1440602 [Cyathus striatus]|nr:hypothetical protein BDQ17DRAFT_1440602 [Cyathus striatus]
MPSNSFSAATVSNLISSLKSEWLMVFDNADGSPDLIDKYLPPGNTGHILITSRNPAHRRVVNPKNSLKVTEMTESSAIELLFKASGLDKNSSKCQEEAKNIVIILYYLPLAIDQVGAYITAGKCEIKDFIKLYNNHRPKLMNNEKFRGASKYEKTVYGTWEISFQKIVETSRKEDEEATAVAKAAII